MTTYFSICRLFAHTKNGKPLFRVHTNGVWGMVLLSLALIRCSNTAPQPPTLTLNKGDHIVLIGNNLGSRMMNFGHFETELQLRYPDSMLFIRNMCDGGNTPGFRPHAGRVSPWAFPGAEQFQTELATYSDSKGHFETPDEWLTRLETDLIIAFFGYNESFQGEEGLANYRAELEAFIEHTFNQRYNGQTSPRLAIVSPIAFEDLSETYDLPDGVAENKRLEMYTKAMREVAATYDVHFVDVFTPTSAWYANAKTPLTIDGSQLNEEGYARFAKLLTDGVFGKHSVKSEKHRAMVHEMVMEKNWCWHNDYKIPNGVHVFGRRYDPFGPQNYPDELIKIREMTAVRDQAIWKALQGEKMDLAAADAQTHELPPVPTNYEPSRKNGTTEYLYGEEALAQLHTAPGYQIELFASEREFDALANPMQMSFDNKGRLWVATMPSYPHYRPGDAKPDDKILILEDTDGDYRADKQTVFADGLHLPVGFEFAPEGVYVSQGTNLILLTDTDGDDKADTKEIVLSGFDDHDTHHVISAFCADPSGAIYMGEGVFLHTNVETSYGPVRGTNGGFYRYAPQRRKLERTAQLSIPNPWGIAFDTWGQNFFCETSSPNVRWMMPGTVNPRYGVATPKSENLIEEAHMVRPTSGIEFIHSRHFPDEVQGDFLVNNTIGFLGTKQHKLVDEGTGYHSEHRQDLVWSDDKNFRPVDMEFAPDGSLYLIDWHNILIGHMQHNARDPYRDHVHGRIYRITYPSRPLVEPAKVAGASIEVLLDNLKLPEYRTRYRTRRELRERDPEAVVIAMRVWVDELDTASPQYEHHLLEALWVSWGINRIDEGLVRQLLEAEDFRARAAAVRVLRYSDHQIADQPDLIMQAAQDEHGRVRLEALVAASWLDKEQGLPIVEAAGKQPLDDWMRPAYETAIAHLNGYSREEQQEEVISTNLKGRDRELYVQGKEIYSREGLCITCHQPNGQGLPPSGFPPIAGTQWVLGNTDRLIKLTLKGLYGPIEVLSKNYPGEVPMTPHEGLLTNEEIAAVLTYVRNSFGNQASPIYPDQVDAVQKAIQDKKGFYSPAELLDQHPLETEVQ